MYLALVAEMQVRAGEAGVGYSLMLEAARKSDDPELFRRAVNIALQSRSGSAAVDAAQAWASELPTSAEPHRVLVQMLISMDRIEDSAISLEKMLDLTPANERSELLDLVGQVYARAKDTALAATVVAAKLRLLVDRYQHSQQRVCRHGPGSSRRGHGRVRSHLTGRRSEADSFHTSRRGAGRRLA
jgi:hypothetical protein